MADIAIENGPVEIVDLPINSMVIFHTYATALPEDIQETYGTWWFNMV